MVPNAKEKRWVLRQLLKTEREGPCLTSKGREFHILGVIVAKARSPLSLIFVLGTLKAAHQLT